MVKRTEGEHICFGELLRNLESLRRPGAAAGVCAVLGIWRDDAHIYTVTEDMEPAHCKDLYAWLVQKAQRAEQVTEQEWRAVTRQMLRALATLHAEGFVPVASPGELLARFKLDMRTGEVKLAECGQVAHLTPERTAWTSHAVGRALLQLMTMDYSNPWMLQARQGTRDRVDLSHFQVRLPHNECQDLLERLIFPSISIEYALQNHPWCR